MVLPSFCTFCHLNFIAMCKTSYIFFKHVLNRGGRGGGYKELDEEEIEETRRRRREAEEVKYKSIIITWSLIHYDLMVIMI